MGKDNNPTDLNLFTSEMLTLKSESVKKYGHTLEYLEGALDYIAGKTNKKFANADERTQALMDLADHPKWKLQRLFDYEEPNFSGIWKFLSLQRQEEPAHKAPQLPEPRTEKPRKYAQLVDALCNKRNITIQEFYQGVREIGENKPVTIPIRDGKAKAAGE